MNEPSLVEDFFPLRPVEFQVLVALVRNDRHGYGIVQDIAERTSGRTRLVPGNLYPVLRRLVEAGLIEEGVEPPAEELDHKQRRYYAITPLGKRVAARIVDRQTARSACCSGSVRRSTILAMDPVHII